MNPNPQITPLSLPLHPSSFTLQNQGVAPQINNISSLPNTQFAVVSDPTSNGQYSFLVPINSINNARSSLNPSYFQPQRLPQLQAPQAPSLPIHQSLNQWYNHPLTPTPPSILPLVIPPNANATNATNNQMQANHNHNNVNPPLQFHIPSTITSISNMNNMNNIYNLTGFPDIKFPLLSSTDCANISPQPNTQLFKLAPLQNTSASYPSSSPNSADSELKIKTMTNMENIEGHNHINNISDNRIISFTPNNSGQIMITKREPQDDTLLELHNDIAMDHEDDKRSIQSSSSTVSTNSVRVCRKPDFQCAECGKSFKHRSNLKIHAVIHTDEALQCPHCGKKFARKSNLTQHLRVHTGERPYICAFCNKSFKQSHSLKDHVRIHTGEKPYECEFCSKSFKVKHNMVVHRRLHTGEKPFDCPLCLKKFASKSSLNGHTKKTHPNQWWSLHPDCKLVAKKYDAMLNKQDDEHQEEEQ